MQHARLYSKAVIEPALRREPELHVYELGDLDDAFWPLTQWHGMYDGRFLRAVGMLYTGFAVPTLIVLGETQKRHMGKLLADMVPLLPQKFFCQLSPGLSETLELTHRLEPRGTFYRMSLSDRGALENADTCGAVALSLDDSAAVKVFYDANSAEHWFRPNLLRSGAYFGIYAAGRLVCVAGVHLLSVRYGAAAVGNVLTAPEYRGRGFATAATAAVCKSLAPRVPLIGLNVKQDNASALACYKKLGFTVAGTFEEFTATYLRPIAN